jgi:hypothetical protein
MTPVVKPRPFGASMTRAERSNLHRAFARVLHINGESTQLALSAAERVSYGLGFRATILHTGSAGSSNRRFRRRLPQM